MVCAAVTTTRKLLSVLISVLEGFAEAVRVCRGTALHTGGGLPAMGWLGIGVSSLGIAGLPQGQHVQHPLPVLINSVFAWPLVAA